MRGRHVTSVAVILLSVVVGNAGGQVQYTVTDLGMLPLPGYTSTNAAGINDQGQVVGIVASGGQDRHSFLYSQGTLTDLGLYPGGLQTEATAINDSGAVTGFGSFVSGGYQYVRAFVYTNGTLTQLSTGNSWTYGYAINGSGQVAGSVYNGAENAVLFSGGTMTNLGTLPGYTYGSRATGINSSGVVVGYSTGWAADGVDHTQHAFVYSDGAMTDLGTLPGDVSSAATAINDSGQIVGSVTLSNNYQHAFLYNGTMTDLGTISGDAISVATDINDGGEVVGYSGGRAFVYANGVMSDLNNLIAPGSGWNMTQAVGVNDSGWIVGTGSHNGANRSFLLIPVPEPSTITLLLASAACLLGYAWRRRWAK